MCDMAGKEKLQELSRCDIRMAQDYVQWTVGESRMECRLQTKMFDCQANMPSRYKRDLVFTLLYFIQYCLVVAQYVGYIDSHILPLRPHRQLSKDPQATFT